MGFDLQLERSGKVLVCGVPANVVGDNVDSLLYDLLREVEQSGDVVERMRESMARVMAQSASRNVGRNISTDEAVALLGQLCECENYSFSPSGKAIMAELTAEELREKLN